MEPPTDFDRSRIDPKGEYPSEGFRHVEELAIKILNQAPQAVVTRTRDAIQLVIGEREGIVVLVTAEAMELLLPTVEWTAGSYGPAESSRLWRRFEADALTDAEIAEWIEKALQARKKEFHKCRFCGKKYPPEYRIENNTCQSCTEKHLGIVY